jgi:CheY-like chemotaxis protein
MTKILLVEDDKSLREIYGVRLLAEGYDIVSAGDGEEALAMAIKDRPNLIVSDVMMPKISGFDMLDILRSTTETKDIKVIMMTALSSEEQRQRGVALGADRYLVKSQVGIEDVVRTVHEVLGDSLIPGGQAPLMSPRPSTPVGAPATPTMPAVAPGPGAVRDSAVPPRPTMPAAPATPSMPTPPTPMPAAPAPVATPAPAPATPSAPAPISPVAAPPAPASHLPASVLPEPTAPFSTPRTGSMAGRVIQPISGDSSSAPDFNHLMNQELSDGPAAPTAPTPTPPMPAAPAPTPATPAPAPTLPSLPVIPVTPPAAPAQGLSFEETPRPSSPSPTTTPPLPPIPPAPNTGL